MIVAQEKSVSPRVLRMRLFETLRFLKSDDVRTLLRAKTQYAAQVGNKDEQAAVFKLKDATKSLKAAVELFDRALVIEMETVSKKEVC